MAIYGYVRCSTNETKQDLNRQVRMLEDAVSPNHIDIYKEYEHGDSATKKELNRMFEDASEGAEIYATEVSRISRSPKQLCDIIEIVKEKHLCLHILGSITVDCRSGHIDPMTEAFLMMAGVFASLELSMIRERVKSGVENARAKGKTLGRPTLTKENLPDAFYKHYPLYAARKINKKEFSALINISRPTLDKYLKLAEEEA